MMDSRTKLLLLLLYSGEQIDNTSICQKSTPIVSITKLGILIYILQEKSKLKIPENDKYEFKPSKYGLWTFECLQDLKILQDAEMITIDEFIMAFKYDTNILLELLKTNVMVQNKFLDLMKNNELSTLSEKNTHTYNLTDNGQMFCMELWNDQTEKDKLEIIKIKTKFNGSMTIEELVKYSLINFPEYNTINNKYSKVFIGNCLNTLPF